MKERYLTIVNLWINKTDNNYHNWGHVLPEDTTFDGSDFDIMDLVEKVRSEAIQECQEYCKKQSQNEGFNPSLQLNERLIPGWEGTTYG